MSYEPHRAFFAPALPSAGLGLLVVGVVAVEAINTGMRWVFDRAMDATPGMSAHMVWYGNTASGLLLQLFSFAFLAFGVLIVAQRGHGRGFASLTGPLPQALRDLVRVFAAIVILFTVVEVVSPDGASIEPAEMRGFGLWLALLPVSLAALLVQTGAEELFYRGYIQQQMAARFRSTLAWMVVPNVMFALAHWQPGDYSIPALQYLIWAFLFGLATSDLTARTGSLGAATGFHLANNAFAFLIFAEMHAPDSGLALVLFPQGATGSALPQGDPLLSAPFIAELAGIGLMWLAARVTLRR